MPIMAGKSNPKYSASSSTDKTVVATGSTSSDISAVKPISETTHETKKSRQAESSRVEEKQANAPSPSSTRYYLRRPRETENTASNIEANLIETWIEGSTNWTAELNQLITLYSLDANPSISDTNALPQDGWTEPLVQQPRSMIEPRNHQDAMSRPEASEWILSENREMDALERLKWAIEVDIPEGAHLLGCKWAYKYKTNIDGTVKLYKSRVVIRGDHAIEGLEYFETYSPVAKLETIRLTLALIILLKLTPRQIDIGNAYIQTEMKEDVYVRGVPGRPLQPGNA